MSRRIYGYARVSSQDQNLDRQRKALADVDQIIEEKVSGRNIEDRAQLRILMQFAQEGDIIRVKSIDRLARNTRDLLGIIDQLAEKGVAVEFVDTPQLNVASKEGKAMLTIFAAFAELERESLRERQRDGIAAAKAAGKYAKQTALTVEQVRDAEARVSAGVPKAVVARDLGVSRQTLHTALNRRGRYADYPCANDTGAIANL